MKVHYTVEAETEFEDILTYISSDNTAAAGAVGAAITAAITRLRSFPHMGTATDEGRP